MEETNETWRAIRRLWSIIVIATLLGGIAAFLATPAQIRPLIHSYRATTTMLVSNGNGQVGTITFNQVPVFATTGEVPKRVAEQVKWSGQPAALAAQVQAAIDPNTGTFTVSSQQPTAARAVLLANAFADQLVKYLAEKQDEVLGGRLAASLKRLDELKGQAAQLDAEVLKTPNDEILKAQRDAAVRGYGAQYEQYQNLNDSLTAGLGLTMLERAQPVELQSGGFSAPQSRRARVPLAAAIGAILGLGLVILMDRFDGRVRDRRRAEEVMGAPVIAELSTLPRGMRSTKLVVGPEQQGGIAESFRTLRTTLTFLVEGDDADAKESAAAALENGGPRQKAPKRMEAPVIVVSSPSPGDGKTTTAANVAAAFGETRERVVVVNADFRRPRIGKFFVDPNHPDPLIGMTDFDGIGPDKFLRKTNNPNIRLVDLSTLNAPPGELSRATARVVAALRPWVDVVIIDTPPLAVTAEALEFMHLASLALIVARVGRTRVRSGTRAFELMRFAGATTICIAMTATGSPGRRRDAYYRYAYSGPKRPLEELLPDLPSSIASTRSTPDLSTAHAVESAYANPAGPDLIATDPTWTDPSGNALAAADLAVAGSAVADMPVADVPVADMPVAYTPGTDTPGTDTPGTDTPGTDTPGTGADGNSRASDDATRADTTGDSFAEVAANVGTLASLPDPDAPVPSLMLSLTDSPDSALSDSVSSL